jgi:hypothetical protein
MSIVCGGCNFNISWLPYIAVYTHTIGLKFCSVNGTSAILLSIVNQLLFTSDELLSDGYTNIITKLNQLIQIQDKVTDSFELETEMLPAQVSNQIIYDNLLANIITVSDYNYYNEEVIREKLLYPQEINKKSFAHNQRSIFRIIFTTSFDNNIKNNF